MSKVFGWMSGLRGKLLFLAALPVVAMSVLSYLAITQLGSLADQVQYKNENEIPRAVHSEQIQVEMVTTIRYLWSAYATAEPKERAVEVDSGRKALERFKNEFDTYAKFPHPPALDEAFKIIEKNHLEFMEVSTTLFGMIEKATTPEDISRARALHVEKLRPINRQFTEAMDELFKIRNTRVAAETEETKKSNATLRTTILAVSVGGCLVSLLCGMFVASRLSESLSQVTRRIASAGTEVSSASEQLSTASQRLSSGATEAASSLEETVSSLEELSSMVKLNADNSKEASSLSQSSRKAAEDGESEIRNLIAAMTDISKSSKKIEEIINVIDDIAFQTNLLALNAAVEAARAGEQGKGFAVVAEAVRNLAQRSSSAAKDITTLIKESVEKITHGSKIADQSGEVLKNIVTSVKKVADLNNEIASASAEQSNGISQISKAMNELDQATQRNAASAEETAASSEEMSAQAVELQGLVGELGEVIEGDKSAVTHHERPNRGRGGGKSANQLRLVKGRENDSSPIAAEQVIPFDDEAPPKGGKVSNLSGF